jgi:hypothetical protein
MLELNAARFVALCQGLQGVRMNMNLRELGGTFAEKTAVPEPHRWLGPLAGLHPRYDASSRKLRETEKRLTNAHVENMAVMDAALKGAVIGLAEILEELRLQFSLTELQRLALGLAKPDYVPKPSQIDEISARIRDELDNHLFLQVSPALIRYYEPDDPLFGADFATKFASAAFELDEAAKCLALERSTAAVFHLMRLLEIGIGALSACLSISPPTKPTEKNCGVILRRSRMKLTAEAQLGLTRLTRSSLRPRMPRLMRSETRGATRPCTLRKNAAEEADHVFVAVRGFMKPLASRCDEQGQPVA